MFHWGWQGSCCIAGSSCYGLREKVLRLNVRYGAQEHHALAGHRASGLVAISLQGPVRDTLKSIAKLLSLGYPK